VRDSFAVSAIYATALAVHRRAGTFRLIDRLITPAAFAAAKMVEAGFIEPARITVLDYFLPGGLPDPKSSPTDDPFFLYIGRISDEKGIRTLIDAMRQCTAARLALAGTGPMETEVRTGLDRWGLTNVELCGFVEGPRKAALLTRALAVVAPSHCYDMSPLSVVESFAAGTPVVAPRLGNFPVAIGDTERGLLFEPGDAADLAGKLGWLLDHADRAHAMGRNARAFAETHYAEGEHYRRLLAIYEQAAA
jgi:glycosyltransferase involved in cell wall biosynthesis